MAGRYEGIPGNLLKLLHDFLYCRKQRAVLNRQMKPGRTLTQDFLKAVS